MGSLYKSLIRPILFTQDSERIHQRTLRMLHLASSSAALRSLTGSLFQAPDLPVHLWGLTFPNPVGLAAGMDKYAEAVPLWEQLGFGFTELGGVTALEQPGNDKPRMFRAIAEEALVNRMGFNNPGADFTAQRLQNWKSKGLWPKHPIAINLGKSKITPLEKAADDYATSIRNLWSFADFFVINVSSPNTPNLRQLQDKSALDEILASAQATNLDAARKANAAPKPILVKVAPDLSFTALDEILELATPRNLAGVVATNTTIARPATNDSRSQKVFAETGGLSGRPLAERSLEIIRHIYKQTRGALPIIGVGGIFNGEDAWKKITAGASLIQIYSGLVYEGPSLPKSITLHLHSRLHQLGLKTIAEAVGSAHQSR